MTLRSTMTTEMCAVYRKELVRCAIDMPIDPATCNVYRCSPTIVAVSLRYSLPPKAFQQQYLKDCINRIAKTNGHTIEFVIA